MRAVLGVELVRRILQALFWLDLAVALIANMICDGKWQCCGDADGENVFPVHVAHSTLMRGEARGRLSYSARGNQLLYELYSSYPHVIDGTVSVVEYLSYSTAKLSDIDDRYYFGVSCSSCYRSKRLSVTRLRSTLGDAFPVVDVRKRLKCQTCGSKKIVVTFLNPGQAVGNLAQLFQEAAV
jgi:hypothetical protein